MTREVRRRQRPVSPVEPKPKTGAAPADYEVGYKKPPRHAQYKPGQSGNPKGRPPRSRSFAVLIDRELDEKVTIREAGRRLTCTKREVVVKQITKKAIEGDHRSQQTLLKYDLDRAGVQNAQNDNAPPAENPLEPDDRAILDAFEAMIKAAGGETNAAETPDQDHASRGTEGDNKGEDGA